MFRRTMMTLLAITSKLLCFNENLALSSGKISKIFFKFFKKRPKNTEKDNDQHLSRVRFVNGKNVKSTRYNVRIRKKN